MKIETVNNIPVLIGNNINIPLIIDTSSYVSIITSRTSKEEFGKFRSIIEFMLNGNNFQSSSFSRDVTRSIWDWITSNSHYIDNEMDYEIISHCRPENIFGYVKWSVSLQTDTIDLFIMNDYTPKLLAFDNKEFYREAVNFGFYEEHFWSLVEPNFNEIKVLFGGYNIRRRNTHSMGKMYSKGRIYKNPIQINPETFSDRSKVSALDAMYNSVEIEPVKEFMGMLNKTNNTIITYEDGMLVSSPNVPLVLFENKNLAMIYAYADYNRYKLESVDIQDRFMKDSDIPLDWSIYVDAEPEKPKEIQLELPF